MLFIKTNSHVRSSTKDNSHSKESDVSTMGVEFVPSSALYGTNTGNYSPCLPVAGARLTTTAESTSG